MISFGRQRWAGLSLLLTAGFLVFFSYAHYRLPRQSYISGWALFAVMVILTAYNARKRLPFLPLGTSESWLQFHIYAGFLTVVLFLAHVHCRMPTGAFQITLAWLYVLVTVSGIAGLYLSRTLPKRLTTHGGEVLYERIPSIRRNLREQAEKLALKSIPDARSATIANFYAAELKDFFEGPRNLALHFFEIRRPLNTLLNQIAELNRFLDAGERETLEKIGGLVRQKDGLDYHCSLQLALKSWLFVHIPLTYSLMIFSVVHIVLVYAFSGGVR